MNRYASLPAVLLLAACSAAPYKPAPKPQPPPAPLTASTQALAQPATPATAAVTPADLSVADQRFKAALDLLKQGQMPEAETALVALSRDYPQLSGPPTRLGILYARTQRIAPAIASFQRAILANPQNAVAYNWLGILQRESRDYVRAEQAYARALAINPNDAMVHLNLGILYDAYLQRPQDALTHYRRYLQLGGQDDLRVPVWIAQLEKRTALTTTPGKR